MSDSSLSEDELFADALALPPGERERFLAERCAGNIPLREQIESLLHSSAQAGEFMEASPVAHASQLFSAVLFKTEEAPEGIIGPYRLRQRLGEGGCGVVYLAEQQGPLRRSVAIKVIKQGMDTKAVIARFEAERQALAIMEHPYIAQVFDAGVTPAGRPFFAMELVRGAKVTDYCHDSKLTVTERITLFIAICRGVQHAHQKGIIHRDLKPSNILITQNDGVPVPKLIDFGIAKATQGRLTDLTVLTTVDQFIGTPAYMSPEQLGLGGKDVDTRSDVYSLGIVLYELLTGAPPFGRDGSDLTIDELRRRIREDDPLRPSSALSRKDISLYYPLAPLKKLIRVLRGDLDWIVLRCLEKNPNLRYQSTHELSSDLERFLANEPLLNRSSETWQSLSKFVRRHRTAVGIGLAMAAVLVGTTSISTWEALRARRAERIAEKAMANEETETASNKAVLDFLRTDLLALASPEKVPDRNLKMRTLVDHAAQTLDEGRFRNQPKVETQIRQTLAETYDSLGLSAQGRRQWEQIIVLNRALNGPEDLAVMSATRGILAEDTTEGKYIQAEELALKYLPLHEKVFGKEDTLTLAVANRLAVAYWGQGKTDEAEKLLLRTIETQRRILGPENLATLNSSYSLVRVYALQDRRADTERLLKQLCEISLRTRGSEDRFTLVVMHALGSLYLREIRLDEAKTLFTKVYQSYDLKWGPEYHEAILAKEHLAYLLLYQAKLDDAEKLFIELIDVSRKSLGPDHEYTIDGVRGLATVYRYKGQLDKAEGFIIEAKTAKERAFGPNCPFLSWEFEELASLREAQGRYREATELYRTTLEKGKAFWNRTHYERLWVLQSLGKLALKEEKFAEAETLLRECVELRLESGKDQWLLYATRSLLGETLLKMNHLDEAAPLLEESDRNMNEEIETISPLERTVLQESKGYLAELDRARDAKSTLSLEHSQP